jgi:hypothetical protein
VQALVQCGPKQCQIYAKHLFNFEEAIGSQAVSTSACLPERQIMVHLLQHYAIMDEQELRRSSPGGQR